MSQVSQEVPFLVSSSTNILTIQDVVLDSPVWRANVLHLEDQIDQFEKWIDGFIRSLKSYIDAFIKYNTQATLLCKRTLFNGLDGTLIDTKVAGNIVNIFATTLQSTVASRMKTVSDLQDQLLHPLQNLVKNDLKSFKDSRKQFDKMLDKYETQLYRYNVLSKQKEASALREDAFQMYELRKQYVRSSGDYFSKLVYFKANLEQMLVECFSSALGSHIEEIDESASACTAAKVNLQGWKQWLDESKITCEHQMSKIKKRCNELQEIYIEQTKPHRSLKRYSTQSNDQMSAVSASNMESDEESEQQANERRSSLTLDPSTIGIMRKTPSIVINRQSGNKQGYLNCRIIPTGKSARPPWARKWVFLQDGWFGTCTVSTVNKEIGCITLGDRVNITECVFRVCTDIDRRFCFEVVHPKCSYYLQAENEDEMQQWLWAIEYNMEEHELQKKPLPLPPHVLLSPKASMTSVNNSSGLNLSLSSSSLSSSPHLVAMSTSPLPSPDGSQDNRSLTPIVSTTTSSLTALMIREGENKNNPATESSNTNNGNTPQVSVVNQQPDGNSSISQQLSSWGMPWLSNGISAFSNSSDENLSASSSPKLKSSNSNSTVGTGSNAAAAAANSQQLVVWPTKLEMDVPTPDLLHYTSELEASQKELRKLFDNVPQDEVVLESFSASLYRKPTTSGSYESIDKNMSYGYSGTVYITQKNLWFYSCTLMACVNMIIIPLEKIASVRLENSEYANSMLMVVDVNNTSATPFRFGLWLESYDVISERLKALVQNAKQHNTDIQAIYDTIRHITCAKLHKNKNPFTHVTTSSALYTSLTPINVQAHQSPMQITSSSSTNDTVDGGEKSEEVSANEEETPNNSNTNGEPHVGSPAQGALAAVYNAAKQKRKSLISTPKETPSTPTNEKRRSAPAPSTTATASDEDWPKHIPKPKKEVKCNCTDHLEKIESDIILPVGAKQLYDLMFSDEQVVGKKSIWTKLNKKKNYGEPTLTEWQKSDSKDVLMERSMTYIMPVSNPMVKAKETDVFETQQLLQHNEYISYVVMVMTKTPNLPYADAFLPCIKYCITFVTPKSCRLVCSMGVTWLKSIFVKGMVNRAATKGMQETIQELVPLLKQELPKETVGSTTKKKPEKRDSALPEIPKEKESKNTTAVEKKSGSSISHHLLLFVFGLLAVAFMVRQLFLSGQYMRVLQIHQHPNTTIIWRGVYLRDIQNEVTEKEAELAQVNYQAYRLFQEARVNGTTQEWKDPWYSKIHRSLADELSYSRERLGAIRYELLSSFRILNKVEYQLVENEYWNWVADQKLKCRKNKKSNKELCKVVENESFTSRDA